MVEEWVILRTPVRRACGGAQSGLGESFTPDLFTGPGNLTVPIAVPQGRNGLQPSLKLVYSTGCGNGVFVLGWALSVPRIARKVSEGVPSCDDARDKFFLAGSNEELVPVEGRLPGIVRYRPRVEGLFARIDLHLDGVQFHFNWGPGWWPFDYSGTAFSME